jgi:hypothetical protein
LICPRFTRADWGVGGRATKFREPQRFKVMVSLGMNDVFGYRPSQPVSWYHKIATRSNQACLYCGSPVAGSSSVPSDKEHLIARNFSPPDKSSGKAFNFIFRACRQCNEQKAVAERIISTYTLLCSPGRSTDRTVDALATHKAAKDYHPDGGLVKDASAHPTVQLPMFGGTVSLNYVGPPRLDDEAVNLLASCQVQGLFSLITSPNPTSLEGLRLLNCNQILLIGTHLYSDWGNPVLMEVVQRTREWQSPLLVVTADGYFKAEFRKGPKEVDGWFWALEWNRSIRVVGAVCDPTMLPQWLEDLPEIKWRPYPGGRMRRETSLSPEEDTLFR